MQKNPQQVGNRSGKRLELTFIVAAVMAIAAMVALVIWRDDLPGDLSIWGNAATTVGPFLGLIGIFIAIKALHASTESSDLAKRATLLAEQQASQSERAANPNIIAARQWLVERRKLESQLDYLFFACPYVLGQIQQPAHSAPPDGQGAPLASMTDAVKSLLAVIGMLQRLRDSLLTYSENHGLLLSMQIVRSSSPDAESGSFTHYLESFDTNSATSTTLYLTHIEGWLFAGRSGGSPVNLSTKTTVKAVTELICLVDYLDGRVASLNAVLEQSMDRGSASDVDIPSQVGQDMYAALSESVKNIYTHLAVFRACLEKEWVLAFPDGTENKSELEDFIAKLLSVSDDERFVLRKNSSKATDNSAGFRFGHALRHLAKSQVFADGPSVDRKEGAAAGSSTVVPERITTLYGG